MLLRMGGGRVGIMMVCTINGPVVVQMFLSMLLLLLLCVWLAAEGDKFGNRTLVIEELVRQGPRCLASASGGLPLLRGGRKGG